MERIERRECHATLVPEEKSCETPSMAVMHHKSCELAREALAKAANISSFLDVSNYGTLKEPNEPAPTFILSMREHAEMLAELNLELDRIIHIIGC